jgi:hypothetical protein
MCEYSLKQDLKDKHFEKHIHKMKKMTLEMKYKSIKRKFMDRRIVDPPIEDKMKAP